MKKNDMIKTLQSLKGNPDILLWNGMVCDYMHIGQMVEVHLFKMTLSYYLECCRMEQCLKLNDANYQHSEQRIEYLKKMYKKVISWEESEYITLEDVKAGKYTVKKAFMIDAKLRGKTSMDRAGPSVY